MLPAETAAKPLELLQSSCGSDRQPWDSMHVTQCMLGENLGRTSSAFPPFQLVNSAYHPVYMSVLCILGYCARRLRRRPQRLHARISFDRAFNEKCCLGDSQHYNKSLAKVMLLHTEGPFMLVWFAWVPLSGVVLQVNDTPRPSAAHNL